MSASCPGTVFCYLFLMKFSTSRDGVSDIISVCLLIKAWIAFDYILNKKSSVRYALFKILDQDINYYSNSFKTSHKPLAIPCI